MKFDPISIIKVLRETEKPLPRQDAREILSAQVGREVDSIFYDCSEILEPEVCDLCGNPPGPGHEGCNRAIEAGLD